MSVTLATRDMLKSQLRRLASDFASEKIEREDYTRRRRTLIDGIVDGDIQIEREPPPLPPPPPAAPTEALEPAPPSARLSPLRVGAGAMVVVALITATWLLWPDPAPPPPPQVVVRTQSTASTAAAQKPDRRARTMVESFLSVHDWGEASIANFELGWRALTAEQRERAKTASWFRRLTKAMRDELKTQRALLEFDKTGTVVAAGARLLALGEFLGVADALPDFPVPDAAAPAAIPEPAAREPASDSADARPTATVAATSDAELTGSQWLATRRAGAYTLQLFAVDRLDRVQRLIDGHPGLALKVLDFGSATPRYRILYGEFGSPAEAESTHASLPESVRGDEASAYIKSLDEMRSAYGQGGSVLPRVGWLAVQDAGHFTLQLFASNRRENVDKLVSAHPTLELRVQATREPESRFRVLYGAYATEAAARAAGDQIPAAILERTGAPLVKSIAELQAIAAP